MDMITLALKGLGIDPAAVMGQAAALGEAFERLASGQDRLGVQLATVQASLDTISAAMGLYVAPPSGAIAALIEAESVKIVEAGGGPSDVIFTGSGFDRVAGSGR